jgi:hypothetical protein
MAGLTSERASSFIVRMFNFVKDKEQWQRNFTEVIKKALAEFTFPKDQSRGPICRQLNQKLKCIILLTQITAA